MIIFDLCCREEHRFEGWFRTADDFSRQQAQGLVTCPQCGSVDVHRLPSAAHLICGSSTAESGDTPSGGISAEGALAVLKAVVDRLVAGSEDVGKAFAEEARKIHYHESPPRAIRGEASEQECAELQEEGIDVLRLPNPKNLN